MTISTWSGKVRDLAILDAERLVMVASDRISAFDVILPTPIPDKGRVLTGLSRHWFATTGHIVRNHLVSTDPAEVPLDLIPGWDSSQALRGRTMVCRRAMVLPVEVVVRGYLAGSGWKDYRATGAVCGHPLPPGLRDGDRLPAPILTPATKAPMGEHDENIDRMAMAEAIEAVAPGRGAALAEQLEAVALALYAHGVAACEPAGILLADTKFEFGLDPADGELVLIDEVLTPDSSRFWDATRWVPGGPQPSFDKQFVRDWLETLVWDKRAPGPELPSKVVAGTRARYVEAFERITAATFERYLREDVIAP